MIMIRLRQRTLKHHLRLKQRLDLWRHLATLDDYRRLLAKFLGFYGPVEAELEKHFDRRAGGLDFERRRKVPMLVSDLRALGIKELASLPRCAALPALDAPHQAFGCLYALEITTLGGQIVARHLNRAFGVGTGAGCSFFNSYDRQTVAMWHDFGQQIKKHAVTNEFEEAMTSAAIDTFVRMEQWMTGGSAAERQPGVLKLVAGGRSA